VIVSIGGGERTDNQNRGEKGIFGKCMRGCVGLGGGEGSRYIRVSIGCLINVKKNPISIFM
jgi:hypothetical protein